MRFAFIISLIFALLISIFAIQNAAAISINLLFTNINVSLALIIFISAATGAIIAALLGIKREFKIKYENKQLLKRIHQLEQEKKQNEMEKNKEPADLNKN
ncbi:MAG: hypothetical protein K0R54_349 [Clostridiaceae bacterium]|jgi:uncharacterized integral membrane protein|nr:hypothetical protein [Clostridiaceae bacterium]